MTYNEFILTDWQQGKKFYTFAYAELLGRYFPVDVIEDTYSVGRYEYLKYDHENIFLNIEDAKKEMEGRRNEMKRACKNRISEYENQIETLKNAMRFLKLI